MFLKLVILVGNWAEWAVAPILGLTTVFALAHEQYLTGVVVAVCAGFVLGLKLATLLFEHRLEHAVRRELDDLFKAYE